VPETGPVTALQAAAQGGHSSVVAYLIFQGASLDQFGDALSRAAQEGLLDVVEIIMKNTPPEHWDSVINYQTSDGSTPLISASLRGHAPIVEYLCEQRAKLEFVRTDGSTALATACRNRHEDVVRILLQYGALVDTNTPSGILVMKCAAQAGTACIMKLLLEKEAALDTPDEEGNAPIHYAAASGNSESLELLLDAEAQYSPNNNQKTPLFFAAQAGHREVVEILLQRQVVDSNMQSVDSIFPFRIAVFKLHMDVVKQFLWAGANPNLTSRDQVGLAGTMQVYKTSLAFLMDNLASPNTHAAIAMMALLVKHGGVIAYDNDESVDVEAKYKALDRLLTYPREVPSLRALAKEGIQKGSVLQRGFFSLPVRETTPLEPNLGSSYRGSLPVRETNPLEPNLESSYSA
jgi:ankyrin repeat protein